MKEYMNTIAKRLFVLVAAFGVASCTGNFEEYNRNPDEPGSMDRDVWDYIKSMQYAVISIVKNQYQIVENVSGGAYGRYFAYAKANDAGWTTGMFAYYRIANDWANPPYEQPMTDIYSNWRAVKAELAESDDDFRMAIAQIVRVASMHRVTDTQGPIPYRTMENNDDITAPYESQEAVYGYMFDDLTHAIEVLETYISIAGSEMVEDAATRDYVYNGDLSKWIRFANSLKLRLAMRVSNVAPEQAQQYALEAVSHPYGVIEANVDNTSLNVSETNDQNPLRWLVDDYNDVHAAAEIVTYMKSYADPRLEKYFRPAVKSGEYHGSRVGAASYAANHTVYSLPVTNRLERLMWMNAAEVAFLKAEMAVNGWLEESAKDLYEEGIRLSFEQYQAGGYDDYIANTNTPTGYVDPLMTNNYSPNQPYTVTVAWDDSLTSEQQREKIITQKWIALYPLGTEAWAEQRRTGYPRFYPTPAGMNASDEPNLSTEGASRIPFAPNEQTRNAENYAAAVALLGPGGDKFGTRLWWDVRTDKPVW